MTLRRILSAKQQADNPEPVPSHYFQRFTFKKNKAEARHQKP
jgi:hypothetical protein